MTYILMPPTKITQDENQDAEITNLQNECTESKEEKGSSTFIPEEVYKKLPEILKKGAKVFTIERERDIFLTAALTVLSGCFPNVVGLYGGDTVFSNLFSFIIAPPASGKGRMKYAREMCDLIHKERMKSSPAGTTGRKSSPLFIPGNTSTSALIAQLQKNGGMGIICESEADTVSNAFKQEWGNFSDLLRKAFQNEAVSMQRRKEGEFIEISTPKLAVALTGTPDQIRSLIPSVEDGLFSRFLYYYFEEPAKQKVIEKLQNGINLSEHFEGIAKEIFTLYQRVTEKGKIDFSFTHGQFIQLHSCFIQYEAEILSFVGDKALGVLSRLRLMTFKIGMVLSLLNLDLTAQIPDEEMICSTENFETALLLTEIYFQHSLNVFKKQSKQKAISLRGIVCVFYDTLPKNFQRKEAITIANSNGVMERTADNYLKEFVNTGYLKKDMHGKYEKIKK